MSKSNKSKYVGLRIPNELLESVDNLAEGLDRSRSWVINDLIRKQLDAYSEVKNG